MQNIQIPDTAETRIHQSGSFHPASQAKIGLPPAIRMLHWLPNLRKHKKATEWGGGVLRSGRGQLRETGSTSTAPPAATNRSAFSRQHSSKDLSILHRDIHLIKINYLIKINHCEDTRPQNQMSAAQEQHIKSFAPSFKEPLLLSTPSFWEWVAPSTTVTRWSLLRSWVLILNELRYLLPSFMSILSITLPNWSTPDVLYYPVLISNLFKPEFRSKPATLQIPIDLFPNYFGRGNLLYPVLKLLPFLK